MSINILTLIANIRTFGPDRVMISDNEAVSPDRAFKEHNIISDIIFVRHDGWSLGAPGRLEIAAFYQWPKEWIGFLRRPVLMLTPIQRYIPINGSTIKEGT